MSDVTYELELYHFGIKGMRWGIRRYQNRDGSLTELGKKHLEERQIRTEDNLVEKTIPKGTKMYRSTPYENADNGSSKSMYVTYLEADRNMYRSGRIVNSYTDKDVTDNSVYEHEFELKTDIRIPSLKTMREIEKKVVADVKAREEVVRAIVEAEKINDGFTQKDIAAVNDVRKMLMNAPVDKPGKSVFSQAIEKYGDYLGDFYFHEAHNFMLAEKLVDAYSTYTIEGSFGRATNVKNAVIKELQKRGYNAMYDNASIGVRSDGKYSKDQEGIEPLIIFDANKTLKKNSTKEVSVSEQFEAEAKYDEWLKTRNETLKKFKR